MVEDEYILRLCPCGGVRSSKGGGAWVCDCDYGSGETHCSSVFKVQDSPAGAEGSVYPWCKEPLAAPSTNSHGPPGGMPAGNSSSLLKLDSPGTACSSVLLTGTLTSCTPIQDYDRVRINLFQIGKY